MENVILIAVLALIIGLAAAYIVRAKKRGVKCIGCPLSGKCPSQNGSKEGCSCCKEEQ